MKLRLTPRSKRYALLAAVALAFVLGYGGMTYAYSGTIQNRAEDRGYFYNNWDNAGWEVLNESCSGSGEYGPYNYNNGNTWCNAIPRDLDNAGEFINFIAYRLNNGVPNCSYGFGCGSYGDPRGKTGAAFIVHTMLGTPDGQRGKYPTPTQWNDWVNLVNTYAANGWINWHDSGYPYQTINTYYQGTDNSPNPDDDAFYSEHKTGQAIVFTAPNGVKYILRRECGNPLGGTSLPALQNFDINGSTAVIANPNPIPGQTVTFRHTITNAGPTSTAPSSITYNGHDSQTGAPGNQTTGNVSAGALGVGASASFNENYTVPPGTVPGTLICRRVAWSPDTQAGGSSYGAPACATAAYNYSLTPSINVVITSTGGPITGNVAEPGDTIAFTYAVNNTGTTVSQLITCTYKGVTNPGYNQTPPVAAFTPAGANCPPPRTFPYGANTTTATEPAVPAATSNTTICRSFTVTPATQAGGSRTANACVLVAVKPYARTYGGDISAGGGLVTTPSSPTSCAQNSGAAIIGWNRRSGGAYGGAGVQFAAYALSTLFDTATSLGNAGGTVAPVPTGLAFANNATNVANGIFGGSFGSVACAQDYWSTKPAAPAPLPASLGAGLATGSYGATGNIQLGGGSVNPGTKVSIYVDGNLFIGSNITYAGSGSWTSGNVPMLRVIVDGNIFISRGVTQLDGLYVAQPKTGTDGIIYTCALPAAPFTPMTLTGTLASQCNPKLTINGGVVAKQLWLLRTLGTLRSANAAEASSSGNIAEVFNYNPMLWISQPNDAGTASEYDAITSLPPVL